jgi:energy-coupling factor transporter ATP-binding protein EcfA2
MNPPTDSGFLYPFGEVSCEQELEVLQEHYYEYFYDQSPFNEEVLDPEIYLIVGRRGSGKTSLTKYFGFQKVIKNCHSVDVDEPVIYNNILHRIEKRQYQSTDLAVNEVRNIWEYLIWSLIFNQYCELDSAIKRASLLFSNAGKPSQFFQEVVKGLINKYVGDDGVINDELARVIHGTIFTSAKEKVIEFSRKEPVIVAVDTFERYDRENTAMMIVTASLIQFASDMNISYARKGIYIKIFVSSEIFPYVKESVISNTIKYIRDPLYLLWRPKDLIRLVSWRLHKHLTATGHSFAFKDIDWENFDEVRNKMWYPFFGKTIQNMRGMSEESFPYILRHIQMRPRQLVLLCKGIAQIATKEGKFPFFKDISIPKSMAKSETLLADEVLNSYGLIYPNAAEIITALTAAPTIFEGKYLDQVAKKTSSRWPSGNYTASGFRRLVAELGIVGRVRKQDEKTGIIAADFEYNMHDRLTLNSDDLCAIHPMFYYKLQVRKDEHWIIYPFPDHEDYEEM